jgi:hypothetical protein
MSTLYGRSADAVRWIYDWCTKAPPVLDYASCFPEFMASPSLSD